MLSLERKLYIARTGTFVFSRGKLSSARIYARSIVGAEGVCFPSGYPAAMFWSGLRVEQVDPRLVPHVIMRRYDIRLVRLGEAAWEVYGNGESLQSWLLEHLNDWSGWSGSHAAVDRAILEHDYAVRRALRLHTGLLPGPCPLRGDGRPLLPPDR